MKGIYKGLIGAAILIGGVLIYRQYKLLTAFVVKFAKLKIDELSAKSLKMSLFLNITNESSIGFDITGYTVDIFLNKVFITKAQGNDIQFIKGNGKSLLKIDFLATPQSVIKKENIPLLAALLAPKKIMVKVKGVVSVRGSVFNANNFPVDIEDTIENLTKEE